AGPARRSRSGLVIADSSRWPGRARCATREGLAVRVALPAGLAGQAGLPAWPPAAGPPARGPSAGGPAGTGTVHAGTARIRAARISAARTGPWVGLPGTTRGTGRECRARVRTAARIIGRTGT